MKISYATRKIEKLCSSSKELRREFGTEVAEAAEKRLSALPSFTCLAEVPVQPPFKRHILEGDRKGQWSVAIKNGKCICLVPDEPIPLAEDGSVDLHQVKEMTIVFVGDYH